MQSCITSYFPTTPETSENIAIYDAAGMSQDARILQYLLSTQATAEDIERDLLIDKHDARRSLTNLTNAGKVRRVGWIEGSKGRLIGLYAAVSH